MVGGCSPPTVEVLGNCRKDSEWTPLSVIENGEVTLLEVFDGFAVGIASDDVHLNDSRVRPQHDAAVTLAPKEKGRKENRCGHSRLS